MKKTISGPDLGPFTAKGYTVVDVESGDTPLSKRHPATPSPHHAPSAAPSPHGALRPADRAASGPLGAAAAAAARERRLRGLAAAAGGSYVISSAALILLNKKVLVHYGFKSVHSLLFYHCL
jgi:hypothetical protein